MFSTSWIQTIALITILVILSMTDATYIPYNESCETTGYITHLSWDELSSSNPEQLPFADYRLITDTDSLSMFIELDLLYLGSSFLDFNSSEPLGTTYILDFEPFNGETGDIRQPGTCQNRVASDFNAAVTFSRLWDYSDTPYNENALGSKDYLAYPPSKFWNISLPPIATSANLSSYCSWIHYEAEFSWQDLSSCMDYSESLNYNEIIITENWINLTGTFFVDIISPMDSSGEVDNYKMYPLLDVEFVIPVRNSMNILSTVGTNLFSMNVIDISRSEENMLTMILLTESNDELFLHSPDLLASPVDFNDIEINQHTLNTNIECLNSKSSICGQLWQVHIAVNNSQCPPTDLNGDYVIRFEVACSMFADDTVLCNNFYKTNGEYVTLTVSSLEWIDEICEEQDNEDTEFEPTINFYNDSDFQFEEKQDIAFKTDDTVYFELQIDLHSYEYRISDVSIDNVWLCVVSAESTKYPSEGLITSTSGCLSTKINIDEGYPVHMIGNGEVDGLLIQNAVIDDVVIYPSYSHDDNIIRFSFEIDHDIETDHLYIHTQLNIEKSSIHSNDKSTHIQHVMAIISMDNESTVDQTISSGEDTFSLKQLVAIILGENICAFICCCILIFFLKKLNERQKKKAKHQRRRERFMKRARTLSQQQLEMNGQQFLKDGVNSNPAAPNLDKPDSSDKSAFMRSASMPRRDPQTLKDENMQRAQNLLVSSQPISRSRSTTNRDALQREYAQLQLQSNTSNHNNSNNISRSKSVTSRDQLQQQMGQLQSIQQLQQQLRQMKSLNAQAPQQSVPSISNSRTNSNTVILQHTGQQRQLYRRASASQSTQNTADTRSRPISLVIQSPNTTQNNAIISAVAAGLSGNNTPVSTANISNHSSSNKGGGGVGDDIEVSPTVASRSKHHTADDTVDSADITQYEGGPAFEEHLSNGSTMF